MSIVYPLDFPSSIKLNSVAPQLVFTNSNTKSPFTSERQAFRWDGEQWQFQYTTPACQPEVADEWIAFAMKLRGSFGTFLMGDYSRPLPLGVGGGSPEVDGASQTGYELNIKNCPTGVTGWMVKGDYFQIGSGVTARLHKLVEDADVDGSGKTVLQFVPKLRFSPVDGAAITIENCVGQFCLQQNSVAWSVDVDKYYHYTFSAEEAL